MTGGFMRRPLRERDRPRAFALAAIVLLVIAGLLALTGGGSKNAAQGPATHTSPSTAPPATPAPAPAIDRGGDARRAARRFLRGYLRLLYGHGGARAIDGASPQLRRDLIAHPPRVSPATRRRHGRVVRLVVHPLGAGRSAVTATIADGGVAAYPIELVTAGRPATVTRLAGE